MAGVATARDVEEVIQKLHSDRARVRDEGVKLLGTWLQGDRAASFCRLLGRNTARFKPGHGNLTGATTWPLLVLALINCVKEDISGKKRGATKSAAARMFRVAVQCAEDVKLSGHSLLLFSVAKQLFIHIWEVIKDGPSFQLEYSIILRQLLNVKEYRYQMKPRIYSNFVSLYMKKVATGFDAKFSNQASSKDESFRCTLTLHVLLENPPGDYPDIMREEVLNGFSAIFLHIREEGKLTRKLMECINTFLLKDGPNLGYKSVKIHNAVQEFIFRCWLATHDQALKSLFITYAKVQLKIARNIPEILEKLVDIIIKELDKNVNTGPGVLWCEAPRDEKAVSLRCFQEEWMDLSATVFYLACRCTTKTANREKRLKTEHIVNLIVDGLFRGSLFWSGSICFLIHKYGYHMDKSLLISWFEASCKALRSILSHANAIRFQDSLLWLLRTFMEFSTVLMFNTREKVQFCLTKGEMSIVEDIWQAIWNSLVHALPLLSSIDLVADSALILLGGMIVRNQVHTPFLSEDTWNLQIFKQFPSPSALYFVACYFSRIGFQGDLSNSIFVRKTLLRSTLELIHSKEFSLLNEQNVVIIPEAIFSLCAGFSSSAINSSDVLQLFGDCKIYSKMSLEDDNWVLKDELPYSVEALSEITLDTRTKVMSHKGHRIHLPGTIQQPMLLELMEFIKGFVVSNEQFEKVDLNNLVLVCSLLCNLIHCALLSRSMEEKSSLLQEAVDYITNILKHIVSFVMKKNDGLSHGLTNLSSTLDTTGSALSSIKSLLSSPIFNLSRVDNRVCSVVIKRITELLDELLVAISQLFCQISSLVSNFDAESAGKVLPTSSVNSEDLNPILDCKSSVADMDLDVMDSGEVDSVTASASGSMGSFLRPLEWKLDLVCIISTFFSVSSLRTWEILYSLVEKESDVKVRQVILLNLCRNISASSKTVSSVVHLIIDMRNRGTSSLLGPAECLTHVHALLKTLIAIHDGGQNADGKPPGREVFFIENQDIIFDLVNKATEISSVDWFSRIKLIDCVSSFVCLFPDVAQDLIGCLLDMLHDADYRVRLYLARQIVVLFQTWEGHNELFNDVCSSIGAKMVKFSDISPVTAREVLAAGPQSVPVIETALITLGHLAVHSEDVEVECVFMISAAAAIEPSQRELAFALFDSISRRLGYASRSKYLDQVMGPILFRWVACEMNLVSLVEVQEMFGYGSAEPKNFVEHCSSWLLPFLILRGNDADMNWISKILSQPLSIIIKKYFVPIFGLCIAVRCGTGPEKDLAETVLCESVLQLGEISELERDDLIKKHMVAIVAFLLSVSSSAHGPQIPYFSKETVALSVRMVVDGFVDTMDDNLADTVVIDKINIFRADRVFKFLLSIHQQVADASHPRHMGHRLCAIEVLIDVLGHRVVLESTCFYIISIVGNYIQQKPLQGQCCNILSKLLAAFDGNTSAETLEVLGRQLQVVVPKLVISCLINEKEERSGTEDSSRVLSLLRQLTVEADPLLYDYIRELEPLPDLDCLKDVQEFHASLSASHSSRDQFLKFVNKAPYLPPELFLLSLRAYHKKLLLGEIIRRSDLSVADADMVSCWRSDPDVISAVWALVDLCSSSSIANDASSVLADFISRAGISDAHQVIFRLPTPTENCTLQLHTGSASKEDKLSPDYGISDDVLVGLLKLLKTYLSDESVEIIDAASQTLRGILSTSRGLNALQFLDSLDRSLLMVHSRGVNIQIVEQTISQMEQCAGVSLEDADVWQTDGRTYKQWLCTLVSSLICHCDDIILRLCRSLVFLKVKAAELLLASTLVNIAGNVDSNAAICRLISTKVEKIIFSDSNHSLKSIHLFLDALNVIRSFYVAEKASTIPSNTLKDGRSARSKSRSPATTPSSSWKRVYWLSVDYLVAARAASRCSCDFAVLMYVELWCEEQFNRLALGPPEFSHEESVHSRGVNIQIVEQTISQMEQCAGVSLEDADVWQTDGRTYKQWLCTLVSSLICHCDDIILRLCRSLVFLKVKAAELLLASTLVNIAGNVDSNAAICRLISTKVEKIIFSDSNHSLKSIHLFLDALNVIRSFYVAEKASTIPSNTLKDGRSARSKSRSPATTPSSSWKRVYWLSVDYLVAARAASRCSCDFAVLMYVELWCEEQFNRLALGPPEFSHEESVHSRGVNIQIVEQTISQMEQCAGVSLEDADVWQTDGRTYKQWLCTLVSSLICHCDDIILRLCRSLVFLKVKAAELLLASTLVNIAGNVDSNAAICRLISTKVEKIIFSDSNHSLKSIHLFLDALNVIRSFYVAEKASTIPSNTLKDGRSARSKSRSPATTPSSSWKRVYWLSVDYLVAARAASRCSCDFAVLMYVELWCEEQFNRLALGPPEFSHEESLPPHVGLLVAAFTRINEPDSIYGLTLANEIASQLIRYEHEGDWSSALEYYDLLVRSTPKEHLGNLTGSVLTGPSTVSSRAEDTTLNWKMHKGLMRSLQKTGCSHVLDVYCEGLTHQKGCLQQDAEFIDIQYEAAWRAGNWDFSFFIPYSSWSSTRTRSYCLFNENLHSCLRALQNGDSEEFHAKLSQTKMDLVLALSNTSKESTKYIHSTILKLQILDHATMVWDLRWNLNPNQTSKSPITKEFSHISSVPTGIQLELLDKEWNLIVFQAERNLDLFEPFLSFRRALLKILGCEEHLVKHLFQSTSALRKGLRFSLAAAALYELKELCLHRDEGTMPNTYFLSRVFWALLLTKSVCLKTSLFKEGTFPGIKRRTASVKDEIISLFPNLPSSYDEYLHKEGALVLDLSKMHHLEELFCEIPTNSKILPTCLTERAAEEQMKHRLLNAVVAENAVLEEAKLLRAQGQHDMAISLGKYILQKHSDKKNLSDVYRLVGKWLAETRSSNSRTIIEDYLRPSVDLSEFEKSTDKRSYEERLSSNEWQAALRLRKYKTRELETLIKRLRSSSKGVKTDYSVKIQELQKQLALDREEAEKIQDDRDNFLNLALQGYQRSIVVGGKYDLQVVFRLVSLWFSLFSRDQVVKAMLKTTKEVQTYKFIPLVYQIASRLGSSKDAQGSTNFQIALASLLKKMAVDHPYHTIFQLLALANGDRVKDKQRSRSSFVVDMEKKLAAENLLKELSSCHGPLIRQMKQMVEIYIKLAELETKKEDTNKKIPLPREARSIGQLELVPVVTATVPVDPSCRYEEGSFPHFTGLADSVMIMNGINAPKVIECFGSDGNKYRQLAKSGNDDLRQDAVMEQFFSLVNTFLQNHRDTSERRLRIRTYKVVPFTPSAGVVEWVNGTVPLGDYLIGSTRTGGAHGRYGIGDWTYLQCREYLMSEKDKRRAFLKICNNFRPVMHHFFLERFLLPADWFQSRLAYTRSVAASSMVGYIVGLGDRHSMNILIDQDTAEVVHIDLGVAFEQGLMLKTPERVPFRLTRDIIDGMGVTGVEGVFRRCCEKTLSVMRANKEALLTIIEVFVHDPLYKWALSPLKALQRQKEIDDTDSCLDDSQEAYEGNKDAARAILRVKQKLDGYEDGEMRSVQGQVQQLIQDAVDVDRLCQMFPGWGPWL